MDEFINAGSNWRFIRALVFDAEISGVKPVRGGCASVDTKDFKNGKNLYNPSYSKTDVFSSALLISSYLEPLLTECFVLMITIS